MTYLPAQVTGQWFYLYLILDLYSRKVVGREVHAEDDGDHAARLVHHTALGEGIALSQPGHRPVFHGDNGRTIKSTTVIAMLHWLGIKPSYSRPRVSDDNAFVESLFRSAKYRPEFSAKWFKSLDEARQWARHFVLRLNAGQLPVSTGGELASTRSHPERAPGLTTALCMATSPVQRSTRCAVGRAASSRYRRCHRVA